MLKLQKLFFKTELELIIFHVVLNKPKGITRNDISQQIQEPRTTIYDNLVKLEKRTFLVRTELNINMPYIKHYNKRLINGKGRPNTLYYVPKLLRRTFLEISFPEIEIRGGKY